MNWKSAIPLILAVVLGLAAAKLGRDVLVRRRGKPSDATALSRIVVGGRDLAAGQSLNVEDLAVGQMSAEQSPQNAFKDPSELAGRVLIVPVVKGQPVLESMLAPKEAGNGPAALLPKGMRAVSIEVNEVSGMAGIIVPGSLVDVVTTLRDEENKTSVSRTIVQNVKVLAVGQRFSAAAPDAKQADQPAEVAKSITLIVTPREAEAIELASTSGRLRLALRSPMDAAKSKSEGISIGMLLGTSGADSWERWMRTLASAAPAVAATEPFKPVAVVQPATRPAESRFVEVIRNGIVSRVPLDGPTLIAPMPVPNEVLTNTDTNPVAPGRMP